MKTFAMLLCALVVLTGFALVLIYDNADGVVLMSIGAISFLCLATSKAKSHKNLHHGLYDHSAE
jgi:hypothetical protein